MVAADPVARGRIDYDSSKPDGAPRKLLEADRAAGKSGSCIYSAAAHGKCEQQILKLRRKIARDDRC